MASDPGATYHQTVIKLCNQTDNHLYADLYWSAPMILYIGSFFLHHDLPVGTARCAVRAAFSGAICGVIRAYAWFFPPAAPQAVTRRRGIPTP
jgi:hypothetical protein